MLENPPRLNWFTFLLDLLWGVRELKFNITERQYVYGIRSKWGKRFIYIGKTNKPKLRLYQHLHYAKKKNHKNKRLQKFLLKHDKNVVMEILFVCSAREVHEVEQKTIKNLLKKKHPLVNIRGRK